MGREIKISRHSNSEGGNKASEQIKIHSTLVHYTHCNMEGPFKQALVTLPMLLLPYSKQLCNAAVKTTATALLSFTLISFTFNTLCSKTQIFESQIFQPTTISTDVHRRIDFGGQIEAHIEQLSMKKRMNKFTLLSARKGEETEEEHKMNERWRTES